MRIYRFYLILIFLAVTGNTYARIKLPGLIADNMVLQRQTHLSVWGWADADEKIQINFKGKTYTTQTDNSGKWLVKLDPAEAGGPYVMEINGKTDHIQIKNVLIGDVWLCGGQSNMVLDFNNKNVRALYTEDIASSSNDNIRQAIVNRTYSSYPSKDYKTGGWKMASPQTLNSFSAAAYFFARNLYEKYHVPIGLINDCVGGTVAESWTGESGLKDLSQFGKDILLLKDTATIAAKISSSKKEFAQWDTDVDKQDNGFDAAHKPIWTATDFDDSQWKIMNEPAFWDNFGYKNTFGTFWLRKELTLPDTWQGKDAVLDIGQIDDADVTYFNGTEIGKGANRDIKRSYVIPASLIKPGKNVITIRVINYNGTGGLFADNNMLLKSSGAAPLSLKGDWKYQQGVKLGVKTGIYDPKNLPTALFNGMIAPLPPIDLKGVIWYQGEYNAHRAFEYRKLFPALIKNWRAHFGLGDLPFIFVQLPNFQPVIDHPVENEWAEMREAQAMALSLPNTAMAVTIDAGGLDLHPADKKDVGTRLALAARKLVYKETDLVSSGPVFKSMRKQDSKIVLTFDNGGSKLVSHDGKDLRYFAIAGADHKFVWATAKINGNTIEVSSPSIVDPVAVRYAWAGNPEGANLYNAAGLPAAPFRTDDFTAITVNN